MTSPRDRLTSHLERGLSAPICLTWEWTYACNLQCVHCLSSSGRRDPNELSTTEMLHLVDEMRSMGIFYVNVGGGEPTLRQDFLHIAEYATSHGVGVKVSTNGHRITPTLARRLARLDYFDVQVSVDGVDSETNDRVRGTGSFAAARQALRNFADAGQSGLKISVVVTRNNISQLDELEELSRDHGAQLRLTRLRPSGRGTDVWHLLHPTAAQQRILYRWLMSRPHVLTGDSFFHLSALGERLPGLNLCGAGRVVCLVDPVGDVYACPFVLHDRFRAGSVRDAGGLAAVWRNSPVLTDLRRTDSAGACSTCGSYDACRGGCLAAKFFLGLDLDGPDPECALGHGVTEAAPPYPLAARGPDHSRGVPLRLLPLA